MSKYYCYVLQSSKDNNLYIGISSDPYRRLVEHNKGLTRSTRSRRPFKIIYIEEFDNRLEVRKRERYLKSGIGRETIRELIFGE